MVAGTKDLAKDDALVFGIVSFEARVLRKSLIVLQEPRVWNDVFDIVWHRPVIHNFMVQLESMDTPPIFKRSPTRFGTKAGYRGPPCIPSASIGGQLGNFF